MFSDQTQAGPSVHRQVRRVQSQSALPQPLRPRSSYPLLSTSFQQQHANHQARSLDMSFEPPAYLRSKYIGANGLEDAMGFASLYYDDSNLSPTTSTASEQAGGMPLTTPMDPVVYNPTPTLPMLYDPGMNVHMFDPNAQEHDSAMSSMMQQ